jgi:hypothetical protein
MIGAGFLIWRACQGYLLEFATTLALLVAMIFLRGPFITKGWGQTRPFEILIEAQWIAWHLAIGLTVMGLSLAWDRRLRGKETLITTLVIAIGVGWLCIGGVRTARKVQTLSASSNEDMIAAWGRKADKDLPANAIIVVHSSALRPQNKKLHRNTVMFYANRNCIDISTRENVELVRQLKADGASLFFLCQDGDLSDFPSSSSQ